MRISGINEARLIKRVYFDTPMIGSKNIYLPSKPLIYIIKDLKFLPKIALDIGCGAGRDSIFLIDKNIKVESIDKSKPEVQILKNKVKHNPNIKIYTKRIQDFNFKKYDLINAQWSLPFLPRNDFELILAKIYKSLNQGGFFAGQFFGVNDEWNTPKNANMTFITKKEAKAFLKQYEEIQFNETKEYGFDRENNPKFWHFFEFVVRKA